MPWSEFRNELGGRRFLVLTKKSSYTLAFLEQLWQRAKQTSSVTVDDLSNIAAYNFAVYHGVLIIERLRDGSAPALDAYLKIYSGANNIVLHALDGEYTSPYRVTVVTANSQELDAEILWDNADEVFVRLREK
ncbi:hypothetical protein NO2_1102 [Candidatus Termititenax persephonae]|uniref:Uncharacterized protein n=1 Tax=Candidatus Termititenax persephonae TaxID=2218525 RepID=A0A388TIF6_9BACT|nr:hypothetical protein NO2_1102 [Candidatus Termititenax persephonae]